MRRSAIWLASAASLVFVAACSESVTAPAQRSATAVSHARNQERVGIPVFVVGDSEAHDIGATVNFWGAQWWKNNLMTGTVSDGVASFKGFAIVSDTSCTGTWTWVSRPGNSFDPPAEIGDDIAVVVTSKVTKSGAAISGDIKQVVRVHQDGGYGPNPGHDGNGTVTRVVCGGTVVTSY